MTRSSKASWDEAVRKANSAWTATSSRMCCCILDWFTGAHSRLFSGNGSVGLPQENLAELRTWRSQHILSAPLDYWVGRVCRHWFVLAHQGAGACLFEQSCSIDILHGGLGGGIPKKQNIVFGKPWNFCSLQRWGEKLNFYPENRVLVCV